MLRLLVAIGCAGILFAASGQVLPHQTSSWEQGTEYVMRSARLLEAAHSSSSRRRLQQQAPSQCGKLGVYVPNSASSADGSMFGVAVSANADGSIVAGGAPLNTDNAATPGAAITLVSASSQTCVYSPTPLQRPPGTYRYFGAQTALSSDGSTLVVADGVEGLSTGTATGNRPVVHVYSRAANGSYAYLQKLSAAPRKSMMTTMAVSVTADGRTILVSYAVAEGYTDKIGSAQVFVRNGTAASSGRFSYLQDLAKLNMPAGALITMAAAAAMLALASSSEAGSSRHARPRPGAAHPCCWMCVMIHVCRPLRLLLPVLLSAVVCPAGVSAQFGASSQVSSNGLTIAVATAQAANSYFKVLYLYRKDTATGLFRIVTAINNGETFADPWPALSGLGVTDDNALAVSQTGRFVLRVESAMLVLYEWSGSGFSMTWRRRCQVAAPDGYTFRTTGGALSVVEVSNSLAKFAAGAYLGSLEDPEQMTVFLYHLSSQKAGSCPYRPAEKHVHNDPFSNYGAGVKVTEKGHLLLVGAPTNWDNNMDFQVGALYVMDIATVADDGLQPKTVSPAANTKAGCVNGRDANGNACADKEAGSVVCKDVTKADGSIVHYGPEGCTPTPAPTSFWTSSTGPYTPETLSAYTSIASSTKGGVGVPVGSNPWLSNAGTAASNAAYLGYVPASTTSPKTSIVSTAGWPVSSTAALGGIAGNSGSSGSTAASPSVNVLSLLGSGLASVLGRLASGSSTSGSGGGGTRSVGGGSLLPPGAVITNLGVLNGNA